MCPEAIIGMCPEAIIGMCSEAIIGMCPEAIIGMCPEAIIAMYPKPDSIYLHLQSSCTASPVLLKLTSLLTYLGSGDNHDTNDDQHLRPTRNAA
ncbi:hypothetical protein MPER_00349, partial [Moniliophthora perniciosa FA553]